MARRTTAPASDSLTRIATRPGQAGQLLQADLGSAFEIARGSVETLMKRVPQLDGDEAHRVHQRATALAVLAARQYREQRLTAQVEIPSPPWRTGLRALVDGPTFESQFNPSWGDNCPPEAIEATTSPAAYLTALFQWVTQVIEPQANQEEGKPIFLAARRPDLAALMLDNHSLERVEPTIGIVNEILESAARKHLDDHNQKTLAVDDALLLARYPFGLPFERYMSQINAILQRKGYSLGELIRQLDPDFPYFCRGGLHSPRSDEALQLDMAIGPEQRALLLEAAYFPRGMRRVSTRSVQTRVNPRTLLRESLHTLQSGFYQRHYGVAKADDLLPLSAFCLRTGLDQDGVESLLSIERHAPVASPNVPGLAAPTPARFGSVYINAGTEPGIGIVSVDGEHALSDWVADHFDRMQRMIRLARWVDLPFAEVDQIIDAALRAEHGEAGRGREISENTLRALGLFRRLRGDFKVSAEDFAALLDGVALYARGSAVPQFDRVFNDPALFSEPLVLDDSAFSIVPENDAQYRRVHHLCSALGISFETYLYLARYIAQAREQQSLDAGGAERLAWSRSVVSAFYRLARLPAWLGLSSVEALAMLQLMGERGHQYVSRLVTTRLAMHQHSELSDTLSVVQALADTVQWLRDNDLDVAWLYQQLMPLAPVAAASDRELDLLRQIAGRMSPAILSEASFRDAGIPMTAGVDVPTDIEWLQQLKLFVSPAGLILERSEDPDDAAYEAALRARLEAIVADLELPDGPGVLVRVFQLVMDARSAQRSLVWEALANLFGGSAELSQELLGWADGSSYQLLAEVLRLFDGNDLLPIPVGDEILALLARLTRRMLIAERLGLSPLALRCWWQHREWFEDAGDDEPAADITFAQLHLLVQYRHLLEFTRQAEQALLDYLKLVGELPPDLSEEDLRLIREDAAGKVSAFTGFGIRDVLETAVEITENGLVTTVRQLDHLVRVRQACDVLQLGTSAALELSRLRSNSTREVYRSAAESALSSLLEQDQQHVEPSHGELGQSEASWMLVDTELLVAKSGDKARCLLTVKNFLGQPLQGITVMWQTDLSTLEKVVPTVTDQHGQTENHLLAGDEMGSAQVVARFGLDRQILAPMIHIDCDDHSLKFKDPVFAPDKALAGNLEVIEYRLRVEDDYENPGRDRVLEWSTDLGAFERPQTRTDADGFASAHLRSLSSGTAVVVVRLPVNGDEETFAAATFLEQRYFQYVRFSGPVATSQVTTVTCRVVNLDGSPQGNVTVLWSADFGGFEADRSITNAEGIASIGYLSDQAGEVTVTINARFDNTDFLPLSSERTTIHELPTLVDTGPAEQFFVIHQAHPAIFYARLEPAAILPVTWWLGEQKLGETRTGADGRTEFRHHFTVDQAGERHVTVRSIRADDEYVYTVFVTEAHTALELVVPEDNPRMIRAHDVQGFITDRGGSGELQVRATREGGVGDDKARFVVSLEEGIDPANLNIVFTPPLGEVVQCDEEGFAQIGVDATQAAFLPTSDPYGNQFTLVLTSNLQVVTRVVGRLRDYVDILASPMKMVEDDSDIVGICGSIQRRFDPSLQLRETETRLRASPKGDEALGELADLFVDSQGRHCFHFGHVSMAGAEKGRCAFYPADSLAKRVHVYSANMRPFSAEERVKGIELTYEGVDDHVLVKDGLVHVDVGSVTDIRITVRSAGVPVGGIGYFPQRFSKAGVVFQSSDVLSDDNGVISLRVDSSTVTLNDYTQNDYEVPGRIGAFDSPMRFGLREFTRVTRFSGQFHDYGPPQGLRCIISLDFSRFSELDYGPSMLFNGSATVNNVGMGFSVKTPSTITGVVKTTINQPVTSADVPAEVVVDMSSSSKRFLLVGDTHFEITEGADEAPSLDHPSGDAP